MSAVGSLSIQLSTKLSMLNTICLHTVDWLTVLCASGREGVDGVE